MRQLIFILALVPGLALAGTFGSVTLRGITYGHDQAGCDAEDNIIDVYNETNVDFVEGSAPYKWECSGVTARQAADRRCPYPQNVQSGMDSLRCFSNTPTGLAVCVSGASSQDVSETYGRAPTPSGTSTRTITRARYRQLFVFSNTTSGLSTGRTITLDTAGCRTQRVSTSDRGGTVSVDTERCNTRLRELLSGNEIPRSQPQLRFCDPTQRDNYDYVSPMLLAIKEVGDCMRLIPNFRNDYTREMLERRNNAASGSAGAIRTSGQ